MNRIALKTAWETMQMIVRTNYEHEHYADTVAKYKVFKHDGKESRVLDGGARYWKAIRTGEVGELITQVHTRETDAQKEQRVRLNNPVTPEMTAKCRNPLQRVYRSNGVRRSVNVAGGDTQAILDSRINDFSGGKSIYDWYATNSIRYNEIDPNAWWTILFSQHVSDDGTVVVAPTPRPVVFTSDQVVYFSNENGLASSICIRNTRTGRDLDNGQEIGWTEWTMFGEGFAIQVTEVTNTEEFAMLMAVAGLLHPPDGIEWPTENRATYDFDRPGQLKPLAVFVEFNKLDSAETPFGRFGVIPDEKTGGLTMASVYEPAKEVFDEVVQLQSEAETNRTAHVFFKKHQYQPKCDYFDQAQGRCHGGTMSASKTQCQMCGGSGLLTHRSGTDVIGYPMPDDKAEMMPLSEMVFYEEHSLLPLEHLMERIKEAPNRAMEAIWGVSDQTPTGNANNPASVNMTATEFRGRYEAMNNALTPFKQHAMRDVKKIIRLIANYAEVSNLEVNQSGFKRYSPKGSGVEIIYDIPDKTELPTVDELTISRQQARDSGAPVEIIAGIDLELIERQYGIDSEKAKWFSAKQMHRPFTGKTELELAAIVAARPDGDYFKTLWLYFDDIFEEIQIETPLFLQMDFAKQRAVIKQKVAILQGDEKANAPVLVARPNFGG